MLKMHLRVALLMKHKDYFYLVIIGFIFILSGCGSSPLTGENLKYVGKWKSETGSIIIIRENGKADLIDGGTKISDGNISFSRSQLIIKEFGSSKSYIITQKPSTLGENLKLFGEEIRISDFVEYTVMELDGVKYVKTKNALSL